MLRLHISIGSNRTGQLELPTPLDDLKRQTEMLRPPASDLTLHVSSADSPIPSLSRHLQHVRLDSDLTLQKLNQLAEVLDRLNAAGLYHLSKSLNPESQQSLDDVLRIASQVKPCRIDFYEVIPGVTTEQALGRWLVEHDRLEDKAPETLRSYLDYRAITAAPMRECSWPAATQGFGRAP